jgi:hypothetical protein
MEVAGATSLNTRFPVVFQKSPFLCFRGRRSNHCTRLKGGSSTRSGRRGKRYDPWGNLYQFGANTTTQSAYIGCSQESGLSTTANTKNQLTSYGYDAAGNLISVPSFATYTYNAENQLVSTAGVNYGDGKRVMKSSGIVCVHKRESWTHRIKHRKSECSDDGLCRHVCLCPQRVRPWGACPSFVISHSLLHPRPAGRVEHQIFSQRPVSSLGELAHCCLLRERMSGLAGAYRQYT